MNMKPFEVGVLSKLIESTKFRKKYLKDMITYIFADPERRYINYIMKMLYNAKIELTVENIYLMQNKTEDKRSGFKVAKELTLEEIENHTTSLNSIADSMIDEVFQVLHDEAFLRFSQDMVDELQYSIDYKKNDEILHRAQAIINYNNRLYRNRTEQKHDPIMQTIRFMQDNKAYQPIASNVITSAIGGWSKGWIGSVIGKTSHAKSTFMTWDSVMGIQKETLRHVDVISPEEPEETFWRRVFAIFLKIPLADLRSGKIVLTKNQIISLKKVFEGKLRFHEEAKLHHILELTNTLETDFVWVDHINSINYPMKQFDGIMKLLEGQREYLKRNKHTAIVNLSQVNSKAMLRAGRLVPQKEDAYNSSALEHASREFLVVYYPYVDASGAETRKFFRKGLEGEEFLPVKQDRVQITVAKNSNGSLGSYMMHYDFTTARFKDLKQEELKNDIILPTQDDLMFDL